MSEISALLTEQNLATIFSMGGTALLGYAIGYGVKKLAKLAMILVGLYMASLIYLQSTGALTIHYDQMIRMADQSITYAQRAFEMMMSIGLPSSGALVVGIMAGLTKG